MSTADKEVSNDVSEVKRAEFVRNITRDLEHPDYTHGSLVQYDLREALAHIAELESQRNGLVGALLCVRNRLDLVALSQTELAETIDREIARAAGEKVTSV